ncbi:hypothetical protein EVAR_81216_1 [Eumeta japonica]|uniref:Uncharacterized protein n=1 Tax=Eumeta variegata TaxID=151549 RepID=A0A4C1V1L8_EUMVA|nr:hypothetical protein EVAR_81216_1 [Eumeta japonica]
MRSTLILAHAIVFFATVQAKTDAEIKIEFTNLIWSCEPYYKVDFWDLLSLNNHIVPNYREVKCLLACVYKKKNVINEDGLVNVTRMYAEAEVNMDGSQTRLENGKKLADICAKVNDVTVSDNSGCDRAALLFECVVDNAPPLLCSHFLNNPLTPWFYEPRDLVEQLSEGHMSRSLPAAGSEEY